MKKTTVIGFAFYLVLLFCVIEPSHHHEDGTEHADCVICLCIHQPIETVVVFTLIAIACLLLIKLERVTSIILKNSLRTVWSRAPPISAN